MRRSEDKLNVRPTWLAREEIKSLQPCVHGGELWKIREKTGLNIEEILDFSSNINPLGFSQKALEAIKNNLGQIPMYPDSTFTALRTAIADHFERISEGNVVVGNGSTEIIYLFADVFLKQGNIALIPTPTFGEYENAVRKVGGEPKHIKLNRDFNIEPNLFTHHLKGAKTVFLCNPNNPTSILIRHEDLIAILEKALEENVLFFLDEDFLEFVDKEKQNSLINEVGKYSNLFVLRSFTKAFGLTGLRVGYGIASEEIIKLMMNAKIPWNVNCLAQVAAVAALTDKDHLKKSRELVRVERVYLNRKLNEINSLRLYPADANFIFINIKQSGFTAAQLKEKLLKYGILIRDCSSFRGLDEYHIRIAVKTRKENERLLEALTEVVGKTA